MIVGALLLVTTGRRTCAIPLAHVVETMRPLPIERLGRSHAFVLGLATIRGEAVPVVDLATLILDERAPIGRFVTLRVGDRRVAVAVESVVGARSANTIAPAPPLLRDASSEVIEALASADEELLLVLRTAKLLPDEDSIVAAASP